MKSLSPQDRQHLDAAEGWLGLGDQLSANEELEQITPELRDHPRVPDCSWVRIAATLDCEWAGADVAGSSRFQLCDSSFDKLARLAAHHKLCLHQFAVLFQRRTNDKLAATVL